MNIVVIVSDTLRRDFLGCYGNRWIKTPSIDGFARESVVFDRAYAASFPTVPARRDIMTGRYSFTYSEWEPIKPNEVVVSELLKNAGYTTMLIADTPHFLRDGYNFQRGFDGWDWIRGQENDNYVTDNIKIKLPCKASKLRWPEFSMKRYVQNVSTRNYEEDYFVAQTMGTAVKWLEKNYTQNKFFLYIDTFDPHEPWDPPKWYVDLYNPGYKGEEVTYPKYWYWNKFLSKKELQHCRALYAGEVSLVDHWVGQVIHKIKDLGLWDNTAVIFTTDHGFCHGEHGVIGKSLINEQAIGYMPLYEEIARIPFIAHIPGVKGGKRCSEFIQLPDVTPTLIDIAKVKDPGCLQGKSILPLLTKKNKQTRDMVVTSPTIIHGGNANVRTTITTKEWTLMIPAKSKMKESVTRAVDGLDKKVLSLGKYEPELYNLKKDPHQTRNVYRKHKEIARRIHEKYIRFLEEFGTDESIINVWR